MDSSRRTGIALAGVLALGVSFAAGSWWGGDTDPATTGPRSNGAPSMAPAIVTEPIRLTGSGRLMPPTTDCDDLLRVYVDKGAEAVGPWGWDGGGGHWPVDFAIDRGSDAGGAVELDGSVEQSRTFAASPEAPAMEGSHSSETGTNVQEAGVDEPDHVKTDGSLLYRIDDNVITAYDVTGEEPTRLGMLTLDDVRDGEILLAGDTLVVVAPERFGRYAEESTRVVQVDVGDPAAMAVAQTQSWDTHLVTARQHGTTVRVVARAGLPDLDFVQPRRWRGERRSLERNQELVEQTTIDDWLPHVTTIDADGGESTERLVDCDRVSIPDSDSGLDTLAVVGFDAADTTIRDATGILTGSDLAYLSADRLYLATGPQWGWGWGGGWRGGFGSEVVGPGRPMSGEQDGHTQLHAFLLEGIGTTYAASGEVAGLLKDRWSMDEYAGVLRVAVGQSSATGNFNSVVTLTEQGDELVETGRVDRLGVNEEIKSMRWFDELAVMVTFRQIDPLYAIDLTDPAAPRTLGELKIPGFTEYLHPLGPRRLIGVGQDANRRGMTRGAQAALFDLRDLSDPQRVSTVSYPRRSQAGAAADPRQFTWLPDRRTALTVVSQGWRGRTGWVSVLDVRGNSLENRLIEVEHGSAIEQVRLVPVGDRVVLVTGDDVSFLDL
ncbi:beta-propeller domain-containing protein [Nocardioides sp.]|uniref:beta-propeller domain-containing protein n=1 Tax=Nocardioides sp. TaxID=35761 RepID=UPI0027332DC3|nr:beta-propeller domain-containing protein [Nocardioides sp.]MDP3890019.1 beta-propeller domain-containing protein [Nocardioides sp.]